MTTRLLCSAVVIAALPLVGCAAGPRTRPVKGADVATGTGSAESVRRQLQGTWELVALESVPPSGGARGFRSKPGAPSPTMSSAT